jgi:hypothetical protein
MILFEREEDISMVNVFAAISRGKLHGTFVCVEFTRTGIIRLDMLHKCLNRRLHQDVPRLIYQDGTPPNFRNEVTSYWMKVFLIVRSGVAVLWNGLRNNVI